MSALTELDAWQTGAPGPFVTVRAGGPLEGVVTLTAITEGHGRTLVEARLTQDGDTQTASVGADSYRQARTVPHSAAAELSRLTRVAGVSPLGGTSERTARRRAAETRP